jgi:hypothetical protein
VLTAAQAYSISSQWGSYMNSFDPGACFYGFHVGDGRPDSELHRAQCIAHAKTCLQRLRTGIAWGTVEDDESIAADVADLQALVTWFKGCDLRTERKAA